MCINYREIKKVLKNHNCVVLEEIDFMKGVKIKIVNGLDDVVYIHFTKKSNGKSRAFSINKEKLLKLKKDEFIDMLFTKYMLTNFD